MRWTRAVALAAAVLAYLCAAWLACVHRGSALGARRGGS